MTAMQQAEADNSAYPCPAPIERYESVVDIVVDFFSATTSDVTLYEGRRPALLEKFTQQVDWEISAISDSRLDGLQLESARTDLLDTVKRAALTLLNPDLMALEADLEQRFFGLERAAKRHGAEKPSEVAAEGWLAYVLPYNTICIGRD